MGRLQFSGGDAALSLCYSDSCACKPLAVGFHMWCIDPRGSVVGFALCSMQQTAGAPSASHVFVC